MYTVATAPGSYTENAEGGELSPSASRHHADAAASERIAPPTSWHTIFAFNEKTHPYISTLPKGFVHCSCSARLRLRSASPHVCS